MPAMYYTEYERVFRGRLKLSNYLSPCSLLHFVLFGIGYLLQAVQLQPVYVGCLKPSRKTLLGSKCQAINFVLHVNHGSFWLAAVCNSLKYFLILILSVEVSLW